MSDFVLASASPRRADLLIQVGMKFVQRPAHIDEAVRDGELPRDYVLRMARTKAETVWQESSACRAGSASAMPPVLGADTIVVLDQQIYTKPDSEAEAIATLLALSGRSHQVLSAVAVRGMYGMRDELSETTVTFNELNRAQCREYWATGEPTDKAGAYAIQGLGAVFVQSISGSYSGVVGLPLLETIELLGQYGVRCWQT